MSCFVDVGVRSSVIARACYPRSILDNITLEQCFEIVFECIIEPSNMTTVKVMGTAISPSLVERVVFR